MMRIGVFAALATLLAAGGNAVAGELIVDVLGKDKSPLADAVVLARPESGGAAQSSIPNAATIGQDDLTFFPFVTLMRRGGTVTFTNNDNTGHHVYSFSPVKQFQLVLKKGEKSDPVTFDTPGVAALGCNIHDQMLAYVYVSDAPFGTVTKDEGTADFAALPPGRYVVEIWHPGLRAGDKGPSQTVTIGDGKTTVSFALPVSKPAPHNMRMREY